MAVTKAAPDTPSGDYEAQRPYWDMIDVLLGGSPAIRAAGDLYLPQFPNETSDDYEYRRQNAKFTNIYADIASNLAAKPFSEEVALEGDSADRLKSLAEDIDGRGNNLNVFAANAFFSGINYAVDWILVDYTKARARGDGQPLSLEDERTQGLRPYWLHIPAKRLLAAYSAIIDGEEAFIHVRIKETRTERDGYGEASIERVRILNRDPIYALGLDGDVTDAVIGWAPAAYEIWEKQSRGQQAATWYLIEEGPITVGVIPLVPFATGRRTAGTWQFEPPLRDAAYLQIEHYQQETALKSIKELTAFPMLSGNGVTPPTTTNSKGEIVAATVPVGPRTVLYAPPDRNATTGAHGEWAFIEPSAESLKFLAEDVKATEQQLRELGRQPLTAQTGNLTVVTTAFAAQKGNSAVQAWALRLKDALEQAFVFTAMWLNETVSPSVKIFTEFDIGMDNEKGPAVLTDMRKNGDISRETLWTEMQRRGILAGDFDPDAERKRIEDEEPGPDDEADLTAAMGARRPV